LKKGSNKDQISKIEDLAALIDVNSLKMYDLKSTEKLIVADLKSLKDFETSDKTKAIFFVYENKITRSNIVTFRNKVPFDNYDKVIRSVFDMKKNKDNYTGKVSFYNPIQNIVLSDEYQNGALTVNGIARRKTAKKITGKSNGCTAWYWVTTYSDGRQTEDYLYTTCSDGGGAEECQTYRMSGIKCGGDGGGSADTGTAGTTIYPNNPINNYTFRYIDKNDYIIEQKFNSETGKWEFSMIILKDIVITLNPENFPNLIFEWPKWDQVVIQEVLGINFIFTYDGDTGNWVGVPEKDPCAAAIELSTISKDDKYLSSKQNIMTAATDGFEHSITLGKDENGTITQAPMNSGNQQYMVSTNYKWPGAIAAIHNHPNNTPLSSGDIYASVQLNEKSSNFTTTYVLINGETYAIVVTNLALAQKFVKNYPANQIPGYSPEFPDIIFNQLQVLVTPMGSTIEGRTQAIAFVLDKYNAGITLLKQNSNGEFNPIKTQETTQSDGTKTYTKIPCN
jgi:hypothetical protein